MLPQTQSKPNITKLDVTHFLILVENKSFITALEPSDHRLCAHLKDKVKIAVSVPLESEGLERAKPLVNKI